MSKNSKMIIIAIVAIIFVTGIAVLAINSKNSNNNKKKENVLNNEPTIAMVDSSVDVSFKQGKKNGEALLSVKNAPGGTNAIEFELSYDALSSASDESAGGSTQQGAIGKCEKNGDAWECGEPSPDGRKIVLGTCSSGTCRYHHITSQIDVRLKFSGSYGDKLFEKKYSL